MYNAFPSGARENPPMAAKREPTVNRAAPSPARFAEAFDIAPNSFLAKDRNFKAISQSAMPPGGPAVSLSAPGSELAKRRPQNVMVVALADKMGALPNDRRWLTHGDLKPNHPAPRHPHAVPQSVAVLQGPPARQFIL